MVKGYTYDANGNMLSKKSGGQIDEEVVKYTYDVWNRLSQFEDADGNIYQYAYNGNGERVSKTSNGETTKFYWDRGYISNESTDGVLSTSNAIGVQGIFARTKDSNEEYLLKDGHGSVTDILSNGTVTDEFEYDAYGNQKTNTTSDNSFRYCGEYYDEESGLIYLRNRYYDPSIGRFITEDPIRDGLNWYVYCGNNPVMYVDPNGLIVRYGTEWEANFSLGMISELTGYSGYYINNNAGAYELFDNGTGEISGGSAVARGMIKSAIEMDSVITIVVDANTISANATLYNNGEALYPQAVDPIFKYDNRSTIVTISNRTDYDSQLIFIHELGHSLTWGLGHYNQLLFSNSYRSNFFDRNDVHNKYMEAIGITLYNEVSNELSRNLHQKYTRDGYYMNGEYYLYDDGPQVYGAFPFEYSNGNSAIIRSLGPGIAEWYRLHG
ncbi:MAG: RHS repeat-associated core domain-containing protein [Ruminococcaceae bacterium]|nr:RHS repeat-associated core domain-containing protein [Oscillospiraceae bacterium]